MKRTSIYRIHREGWPLVLGMAVFLVLLNLLSFKWFQHPTDWIILGGSLVFFPLFSCFFRFPKRVARHTDPRDILSPADGRIVVVEPVFEPHILKKECLQVSVFMSLHNVHANWYPVQGEVKEVSHRKGRHQAAFLPKSSQENEQSSILMVSRAGGHPVLIRQIAGAMAQRIVTYARPGHQTQADEQLGFIKFGSRVDMFLPLDAVEMLVDIGETVKGNQTLIARFKA